MTFDGFEDVLDREFSGWLRGEAIVHSVGSEWALLRVREWLLLEGALSATLVVNGGSPCCRFGFAPSLPRLKDGLAELFITPSIGCMVGLGIGIHSNM